jgi:CheY-like chemotaxis protein
MTSKVLLAESDSRRAMELTRALRSRGYDVVAGNDAIHVLNAARQEKPDLILLSGMLAGGGAPVALRRLRSNVYTTGIPVVGLVARGGASEKDLLAAGAQAVIPVSADGEALQRAVEAHVLQSLDFTEAPAEVLGAPERMAALEATRLLDSPPEEAFDRLTRLASSLVGAPTALVTLVDRDRQFFKSQVGLGEPWASERQTRLSHSFCQWVVSANEELVVRDATEHPVLRSNLAIRHLGVIAYAGVPLAAGDGQPIGSFCAIDSTPREWTREDLKTLADLAAVTQAYSLPYSPQLAGGAIVACTRMARRFGRRLTDDEGQDLLAIIEEQGRRVAETR